MSKVSGGKRRPKQSERVRVPKSWEGGWWERGWSGKGARTVRVDKRAQKLGGAMGGMGDKRAEKLGEEWVVGGG